MLLGVNYTPPPHLPYHISCYPCSNVHIYTHIPHKRHTCTSLQNPMYPQTPSHTHPHTHTLTHSPPHTHTLTHTHTHSHPHTLTLTGVTCPLPGLIAHGQIVPLGQLYFCGTTVRFRCRRGYRLVGSSRCTCQANGTWSSSFPTCQL